MSAFKVGSQPYKLNEHFKQGGSLTHEEAHAKLGVGRLAQRIQDLKKKYLEYAGWNPIMVIYEQNERGGTHARYFFKNMGCPHENKPGAKEY